MKCPYFMTVIHDVFCLEMHAKTDLRHVLTITLD